LNPELLQAHDNHGAHFEYGCDIPRCSGHVVRGVGMMCRNVFTVPVRAHRFASTVVTPQGESC
jgi:hypothetical protein